MSDDRHADAHEAPAPSDVPASPTESAPDSPATDPCMQETPTRKLRNSRPASPKN
ncbi:MAG: hypothetical protein ABIP39_03615 [Polyangiaceae bacterium]